MRRVPRALPSRPAPTVPSAAELGFRMPGEFEPQDAVWLAWPGRTSRQWAEAAALTAEVAALARTIRRFEPVTIAVDPAYLTECRTLLGPEFGYRAMPLNDIWIRDTGPSLLVDAGGNLGAALWNFNGWGDKFDGYDEDAQLAGALADSLRARRFVAGLITEGGALHVDGEGTVVATDSALLNDNRNPGMTRADLEAALHASLGTSTVIWLPGGGWDSITDGHVDGLMTFSKPGAVLVNVSDDPAHPKYRDFQDKLRALQLARDARGRTLEILPLHLPRELPSQGRHFCGMYVNCLIVNGAVVIPEFGDVRYDAEARAAFETAFGGRTVLPLRIDAVAEGGGGIHCISQQQPASGSRSPR